MRPLLAGLEGRLRHLQYSYLFVPGLIAAGLGALAVALTRIDRTGGESGVLALFPAGPTAAGAVLSTIATAVATVAAVSFSITVVSLQLVSQQFTPRALRGFLSDRLNQAIAGYFVGVFAYCLVALRAVEAGNRDAFLPGLTVTVAVVLALIALGLLLVFIDHMGRSIQVSEIARRIADRTLASAAAPYPAFGEELMGEDPAVLVRRWSRTTEPTLVYAERTGFVQAIDDVHRIGSQGSLSVELQVAPGDFVTAQQPVARVWGENAADGCATALRGSIRVGSERVPDQDVGYGIRQLTDIAVRALSPGFNDPTTATTCISYLRSILEELATRPPPAPVRCFGDRRLVVVAAVQQFADHMEALVEIGRYAARHESVVDTLLDAAGRISQLASERGSEVNAGVAADARARIAAAAKPWPEFDDGGAAARVDELDRAAGTGPG